MEFLVEIDKLVQLIESPIFACKLHVATPPLCHSHNIQFPFTLSALRLTLISNRNGNADAYNLTQALFGILMLLPQTEAFTLLKNRLQCVMWDQVPKKSTSNELSIEDQSGIDFAVLLDHFKSVQDLHQQQRHQQRKRNVEIAFNDAK